MLIVSGVSKEDLELWQTGQVTQAVLRAIRDKQREIERYLGRGEGADKDNPYHTQATVFEKKGEWQAYENILIAQVVEQ